MCLVSIMWRSEKYSEYHVYYTFVSIYKWILSVKQFSSNMYAEDKQLYRLQRDICP